MVFFFSKFSLKGFPEPINGGSRLDAEATATVPSTAPPPIEFFIISRNITHSLFQLCRAPNSIEYRTVMWIRIRLVPHHFGLPDPGSKKSAKIMGNSYKTPQKLP